jgi:uncharacterized protein YndB with AHSA1/START domain
MLLSPSTRFLKDPRSVRARWSRPGPAVRCIGDQPVAPQGDCAVPIPSAPVVTITVLCMRSPAGKLFWNAGTYLEIVSRQRIVQSVSFADEQGHPVSGASAPVPGKWPDHITVILEFRAVSGCTEVSIEERGIPLIVKLLFAGMGWQQQFDKMVTILR